MSKAVVPPITVEDDLVARLRGLARMEHGDFTIGQEAADRIDDLTTRLNNVSDDAETELQKVYEALAFVSAERDRAKHERDWLLHNGGMLAEWAREWTGKEMSLIAYLKLRLSQATQSQDAP